jgi:2-enoate reductase
MKKTFRTLLAPIKIGNVEIKNRIAMAPMAIGALANLDGSLGPRALDYYVERIRGDVGLIITSNFKVENDIDLLPLNFMFVGPTSLGSFAELAEVAHAFGSKVFVQLTAGFGRVASPRMLRGQPVSASAIPNYWDPTLTCRELATEEVERIVKAFGPAAQILAEAGIDGIELHGHEGYLFDQFATALWNHRTDKYGGDLVGRLTFPIEVLREIKGRVGPDFPVQYRFGLKHYIKGLRVAALPGEKYVEAGRDVQEGLRMARILEEAGFDALHVDAGCYDSWYWAHPPGYQKHGCMVDMAAEVKKVVRIPVIAVGRLELPELAEQVIAEGKADMVALGRGLLADPYWVKKLEEGRKEHIRPCVGCLEGCMGRLAAGKPISCAVNPACGREKAYALEPTCRKKKVMIIGGGVAGMEAARVTTLRGHEISIYEKTEQLGGHVIEASVPPFKEDEQRLLKWYQTQLKGLGVEINLNTEVTIELVRTKKPEVVIVATGSKPILLNIPGVEKEMVTTASHLLLGKKKAGEKVIVVGGGKVGCETALWLAQQGKKVTLVEKLGDLMAAGPAVPWMTRVMLLDLLAFHKVKVMLNTTPIEVLDDGVVVDNNSLSKDTLQANSLVVAVGLQPMQELYQMLKREVVDLYIIGDARKAWNIMSAIWDAYEVARSI